MSEKRYTASLSRTQGRSTFSIIFRHPVRIDDSTGKPGLRVRQSLKTSDEREAEFLRGQLNEILATPRYWDLASKPEAEKLFDPRVTEIFFYKIVPEETNFEGLRDAAIPLPGSKNTDFRRVLLLGTTGAGKTTLLRQLIGTDPEKERFPSTSTAKTTIHDTEVILRPGLFQAVVTFFPAEEVRAHLSECVSAAVLACYRGESDSEVLRKLLTHVNQRFRFSYVLGNGPAKEFSDFDDETFEDQDGEGISIDLEATNSLLEKAILKLKEISSRHGENLKEELNARDEKDLRVVDELFEEELDNRLRGDEDYHLISDEIMDEIEKRFDLLSYGKFSRNKQGWPISWHWETAERAEFIKAVSQFSSNNHRKFGTLLTPLVNGVRIAGPFGPTWADSTPSLVILDGEGLGHTPKSVASISTSLTKRIDNVDAVLLVDSATQPMQAAPVAAMREMVTSGNAWKLIFSFTHFDEVRGDNLPSPSAKAQHVLASAENVLASIGEDLHPSAERTLRLRLQNARFFLGGLDQKLSEGSADDRRTISQLKKLLGTIEKIVDRPTLGESKPAYSKMNLVLAVERAAKNFHDSWWPRLGLELKPGESKEHWTRIKALSRRLAAGFADEYNTLKPVADLRKLLQDRIYVLLQNPLKWTNGEPDEDQKQEIINSLSEKLSRRLLELSSKRLKSERLSEWQEAYNKRGTGSTFVRANIIGELIFDKAAPIPDIAPSPDRNSFLNDVALALEETAKEVGAHLE